jgi:hypothetical protein
MTTALGVVTANPKDNPLAISNSVCYDEIESKNGETEWVPFTFSGNNRFQTANGEHYFICLISENISNYGTNGHVAVCITEDSLAFNGGTTIEGSFNGLEYTNWTLYAVGGRVLFQCVYLAHGKIYMLLCNNIANELK